jgi:hypothetical protein
MRQGETRLKFPRHHTAPRLEELRLTVAGWARANFPKFRELAAGDILAAEGLHDRARDNWQPLMAIARAAGAEWEERASRASLILSKATRDAELLCDLLADIKQVFDFEQMDRLRSVVLVEGLVGLEARPWGERRLTATRLAKMLRPLRIQPQQLWTDVTGGKANKQGYERAQFEDAFARYLE